MKRQKSLLSILLCIWTFGSVSFAQADVCVSNYDQIINDFIWTSIDGESTLISGLIKYRNTSVVKSGLIEHFCDTRMLTHKDAKTDVPDMAHQCLDSDNMRFDPRQSLFMYGLCVGYDEFNTKYDSENSWHTFPVTNEKEYIYRNRKKQFTDLSYTLQSSSGEKWKKIAEDITKYVPEDYQDDKLIQKRWLLDAKDDPCHPAKGMTSCKMWYPTKNILTQVFAGLFDIKKAAIDGYKYGTTEKDVERAIADLSISLYDQDKPWSDSWVCLDANKQFLMKEDSSSNESQSHCGHPKTRGEIKSMIVAAGQDVKSIEELAGEEIAKTECQGLRETMIPCAMSNLNGKKNVERAAETILRSEELAWRNVVLQELFFANMWADYYSMIMEVESNRDQTPWDNQSDKFRKITQEELGPMKRDLEMIERSADRLMNLMWQYRTMYHECVTLKAYQEDLHYYWQRLNKMYTPVHQNKFLTDDAQEQDI